MHALHLVPAALHRQHLDADRDAGLDVYMSGEAVTEDPAAGHVNPVACFTILDCTQLVHWNAVSLKARGSFRERIRHY